LLDQKVRVGGVAELKVDLQGKVIYVFYLVTKVLYHHKPAPEALASALTQLRDRLVDLSINLLIIPKLGETGMKFVVCCIQRLSTKRCRLPYAIPKT